MNLTGTITAVPRPWWRPFGVRAFRKWYREARRQHGRTLSTVAALYLARKEFRVGRLQVA